MSRKLPEKFDELTAESLKFEKQDDGRVTQTRKYKLITPLFGGGVEAKKADPIKVIRETSIRGQLRFWWRAMRGVGTLQEMKKREDALFGSGGENSAQSKILIFVKEINNGESILPNSAPKYAAFPLEAGDTLTANVTFTLEIAFPSSEKDDVEAALWAWETFGGIGGRTRRGFGAIRRVDNEATLPSSTALKTFIQTELNKHLAEGDWDDNSEFPRLQSLVVNDNFSLRIFNARKKDGSTKDNCGDAWKHLIMKLQDFRQSPRIGGGYIGESHWSEPDAIRVIVGTHAINNPPRSKNRNPTHRVGLLRKFPRAQFGLPIIFKFKEDRDGDPQPQTLKTAGADKDRLASPLILRPIACANGEAVALALILKTPPLRNVELQGYGIINTQLDVCDITGIRPMLYGGNTTETDVLKIFLRTI